MLTFCKESSVRSRTLVMYFDVKCFLRVRKVDRPILIWGFMLNAVLSAFIYRSPAHFWGVVRLGPVSPRV